MRVLGQQRYECSQCNARVLVAFSDARPAITFDDTDGRHDRVVTVSDVEVHRCPADTPPLPS